MDGLVRLYARLLWLLPGAFRRAYAEPMRQTFADQCAATLRRQGAWGLVPVGARTVADLAGGAAGEWSSVLFARATWHRTVAVGSVLAVGLLVLVGLVRYPAELTRVDIVLQDLLVLALLVGAAERLADRGTMPAPVVAGLATAPCWVAMLTGGPVLRVGGLCLAVALTLGIPDWRTGVVAGVAGLGVNVGHGLVNLGALLPLYRSECVHSGQTDLAAYVVGARIDAGALLLFACAALGFTAAAVIGGVRYATGRWRYR